MRDIEFHPNGYGDLCATLRGWDTTESVDGYTIGEIDLLIESLHEARTFILNNNVNDAQETFNFEGNTDV